MATLRYKRKLAAVSRETPENTRNRQSQNTLDPEIAQEYISQVSAETGSTNIQKRHKPQPRELGRSSDGVP